MSEDYRIIGAPRGEPRALGNAGVGLRVQLSGCPSRRWSRDLGARLTRELVGHPSAAHLRMNIDDLVQGDEIVLDGVEDRDAPGLAAALRRSVDAANHAELAVSAHVPNVTQAEADTVASHMSLGEPGQAAMSDAADDPLCPRCGEAVSVTAGNRQAGDQLAVSDIDCPNCGARLVREMDGHADRGWRLAD